MIGFCCCFALFLCVCLFVLFGIALACVWFGLAGVTGSQQGLAHGLAPACKEGFAPPMKKVFAFVCSGEMEKACVERLNSMCARKQIDGKLLHSQRAPWYFQYLL